MAHPFLDYLETQDTFTNKMTELNSWSPVTYAWIGLGCFLACKDRTPEIRQKAEALYAGLPAMMNKKRMGAQGSPPTENYVKRKMKFYETKKLRWVKEKRLEKQESVLSLIRVPIVQEMMYFWNLQTHMSKENLDQLLKDLLDLRSKSDDPKGQYDIDTPDESAVRALLAGACYRAKKEYASARQWLKTCINLEKDVLDDRWTIPFAMYEMAIVEMLDKADKIKAEEWNVQVLARSNYVSRRSR